MSEQFYYTRKTWTSIGLIVLHAGYNDDANLLDEKKITIKHRKSRDVA
jgi:hypothetical protein